MKNGINEFSTKYYMNAGPVYKNNHTENILRNYLVKVFLHDNITV